jgi:hypothetical protein
MRTQETVTIDFDNKRILVGKTDGSVRVINAWNGVYRLYADNVEIVDTLEGEVECGMTSLAELEWEKEFRQKALDWLVGYEEWKAKAQKWPKPGPEIVGIV